MVCINPLAAGTDVLHPPYYLRRSLTWLAVMSAIYKRREIWNPSKRMFDVYLGPHYIKSLYFGG